MGHHDSRCAYCSSFRDKVFDLEQSVNVVLGPASVCFLCSGSISLVELLATTRMHAQPVSDAQQLEC